MPILEPNKDQPKIIEKVYRFLNSCVLEIKKKKKENKERKGGKEERREGSKGGRWEGKEKFILKLCLLFYTLSFPAYF